MHKSPVLQRTPCSSPIVPFAPSLLFWPLLLHDSAASAALLGRIRVVLLVDGAPDRGDHEVLRAIRVGDDATARVSKSVRS
jgi:hypothetical protein